MAGGFSAGGLITGIDSASLIRQLILFERRPIIRMQDQITLLGKRKDAILGLRTQLRDLRNLIQDFNFNSVFEQFRAESSDATVLSGLASGPNPVSGTFNIDVLQVATATLAESGSRLGATIDPNAPLATSGIRLPVLNGSFTINGVAFGVDPNLQSLNDVLNAINASAAGVNATFDAVTDTVTFTRTTAGDTSAITFGAAADTGNFLNALNVVGATQTTGGGGTTEVTSTGNLGAINTGVLLNTVNFATGSVTAGSFQINGVSIAIDPTTDTVSDVIERINVSAAGVTASYDPSTDSIRVVSNTLGSRTISFVSGTSNFLDITNLTSTTQAAGNDSQFTVDGGAVQTRNTNDISDVIGDVTLTLLGVGTSTLTLSSDTDSIIENVKDFVTEFNESIQAIVDLIAKDGDLAGDASIRGIQSRLRSQVFQQVAGLAGEFDSLLNIGISTGDAFDASAAFQLVLDEDELREALASDRTNVGQLFVNDAKTGIADRLFDFLDGITNRNGFLNSRAKASGSIDSQIRTLNDRIDSAERRVALKEARLRAQFANLELIISTLQSQSGALLGLSGGFSGF
ncbi:MAG: flagellar filament capping protein FliD [Candidatus Hydrogenedentes bacterium]|nr:flagellar filament capping protein FliD [Candidatus Hydrogenedentota bacterium]